MAIGISNIPYGTSINTSRTGFESPRRLVSDGRVEDAFVSFGAAFIADIQDPRVRTYAATGEAPGPGWKADDYGYACGPQTIGIEEGEVVLRTSVNENGTRVDHKISAPYDIESGKIDVASSTEGFKIFGAL